MCARVCVCACSVCVCVCSECVCVCVGSVLLDSCNLMDSCNPMDCSPPGFLSMDFLGKNIRVGWPSPPPGGLPDPGTEPASLALADSWQSLKKYKNAEGHIIPSHTEGFLLGRPWRMEDIVEKGGKGGNEGRRNLINKGEKNVTVCLKASEK